MDHTVDRPAIRAFVLAATVAAMPCTCVPAAEPQRDAAAGLVGHWQLRGDCQDSSGHGHHGINHGVDLKAGRFDGRSGWIEVPGGGAFGLGRGDFTVAAWVHTDEVVDDTIGDVVSLFDPSRRRGFSLTIQSSSGGYQSSGDDRQVFFGIDDAVEGRWEDCGRPSPTSNYVGNCLTVFRGDLYASTFDGAAEADWCHVYRHAGGTRWEDCGSLGEMRRIMCMATYGGRLYVGGDRGPPPPGESQWTGRPYRIYRHEGGTNWSVAFEFPLERSKNCFPHAMAVHDGRLFAGIGSCTSAAKDAPVGVRGSVFSYMAGRCVSYEKDMGPGWRHLAAVRQGDRLRLHVDGRIVATSAAFDPDRYDLTTGGPLKIGFGEQDYFTGLIRDVRLYRRGLDETEIATVRATDPPTGSR